jgi:hypothetical protein
MKTAQKREIFRVAMAVASKHTDVPDEIYYIPDTSQAGAEFTAAGRFRHEFGVSGVVVNHQMSLTKKNAAGFSIASADDGWNGNLDAALAQYEDGY